MERALSMRSAPYLLVLLLGLALPSLALPSYGFFSTESLQKSLLLIETQMTETREKKEDLETKIAERKAKAAVLWESIGEKKNEMKRLKGLARDYGNRIDEAEVARKDFQKAITKNRRELVQVRRNIVKTKQKLGALEAVAEALMESSEVSEEGLSKIIERRIEWRSTRDTAQMKAQEIKKEIAMHTKEIKKVSASLYFQTKEWKKWNKNFKSLQKKSNRLSKQLEATQNGKK